MPQILTDLQLKPMQGLWHGMKTEHFLKALEDGSLLARTMQRYWKGGGIVFDDQHEEYEKSFWMKGWSTTRDRNYAMGWGDVVLLLDEEAIKRDFKVKPFSWNATLRCAVDLKKEREEFIVAEFTEQTSKQNEDEFNKILDNFEDNGMKKEAYDFLHDFCGGEGCIGYWRKPAKKQMDFKKYVKGFLLRGDHYHADSIDLFHLLEDHELFLGYFSKERARHNNKISDIQPFKLKAKNKWF